MVSALRELGSIMCLIQILEPTSPSWKKELNCLTVLRNIWAAIETFGYHTYFLLPSLGKFLRAHFPELKDVPSTARSPQQMFGAIAKTYFANQLGIDRKNLVVVSIMPCLAKKYESSENREFSTDGNPDVDFSLSTRRIG
jgi:hypothetical protein